MITQSYDNCGRRRSVPNCRICTCAAASTAQCRPIREKRPSVPVSADRNCQGLWSTHGQPVSKGSAHAKLDRRRLCQSRGDWRGPRVHAGEPRHIIRQPPFLAPRPRCKPLPPLAACRQARFTSATWAAALPPLAAMWPGGRLGPQPSPPCCRGWNSPQARPTGAMPSALACFLSMTLILRLSPGRWVLARC
jgi:hypothetical protein